jgi:hypothetical protein
MSWDKIWLLEGCPYFIDWFIDDQLDDLGNPNILKLDHTSSASEFISAITAFPFYDVPDLVIINNPDAEILNACLENINNIRSSGIIFTCEYNTFDGRQSFISKANKNKRLKTFDYYEQGEDLSKFFSVWKQRIKFSNDCLPWLNKNAPTRLAKAKINGQKKEIIIVDLIKLDRELNKVYALYLSNNQIITIEHLSNFCNFNKESEIWTFLDAVVDGDMPSIINYFDKNRLTTSNEGPLWVISSQIELYIQLKGGDPSGSGLTLSDKLNFYLSDTFEPLDEIKPKAPINPYRLKMALDTCKKISLEVLINKYLATINAIRDLRAGLSPDIITGLLCLAYSNKNKYLDPVYDV